MKKTRVLLAAVLMFAVLLSLSACKKRTPAALTTVRNEMIERGFEVEALEPEDNGVPRPLKDAALDGVVFIKYQEGTGRLLGTFAVFQTEDDASRAYDYTKAEAEADVTGVKTRLANELPHYEFLRVSAKTVQYTVIRVENTLLYLDAGPAFFDEADEIAQNLGYK